MPLEIRLKNVIVSDRYSGTMQGELAHIVPEEKEPAILCSVGPKAE